ncbi:MAG: DUF1565 domain-containing protein [Victivallales bacterium]|nr:DUF1565 domain-containing protein [Victivallales bacterium]
MKLTKIFAAALLGLGVATVSAADWYASITTGKNKNAGNEPAAPFKNLWKALETAQPGDTIHVAEGNYPGKMSVGWIKVTKAVTILGGYKADFSARDPLAYPTMLRPANKQNATKPPMGSGTLTIDLGNGVKTGKTVIDGLYMDHGDASSYHATKGKPENVETGMYLTPPAKGNTEFASIDSCMMHIKTGGELVIQNCIFLNASNYALQGDHFDGDVKVLNNVFINSRMIAVDVRASQNKLFATRMEFAYNTVLFNWSRTSEMTDMGYGVRANRGVDLNVHHNILGLSVFGGFDDGKVAGKETKIKLDNNVFFLNKKADCVAISSPNLLFFNVDDDAFEDFEEYPGIESLNDNTSLKDPAAFKGIIDEAYLKAFVGNTYSEKTDLNRDSVNNTLRALLGMNLQGTITTKVGMFFNRYPAANVPKFFGAIQGVGAQAIAK